jgi:hypothetical protein
LVSVDRLYGVEQRAQQASIQAALRLLKEASDLTTESIAALRSGDAIVSDDYVNRLEKLLVELFCCRRLGNGLALVVNDLTTAIRNRPNAALDAPQLLAVESVVAALRNAPFISKEDALELVERLEDSGLDVTPLQLNGFADAAADLDG